MGKYTQLSITDRRRMYVFLEMGLPVTEIAQKLSRNRFGDFFSIFSHLY